MCFTLWFWWITCLLQNSQTFFRCQVLMAPVQWSTWQMEGNDFRDQILTQIILGVIGSFCCGKDAGAVFLAQKDDLFFLKIAFLNDSFSLFHPLLSAKRNFQKDKPKRPTFRLNFVNLASSNKWSLPSSVRVRSLMLRFPVEEAAQAAEAKLSIHTQATRDIPATWCN